MLFKLASGTRCLSLIERRHDQAPAGEPRQPARLEACDRPTHPAFSTLRPGGSRAQSENIIPVSSGGGLCRVGLLGGQAYDLTSLPLSTISANASQLWAMSQNMRPTSASVAARAEASAMSACARNRSLLGDICVLDHLAYDKTARLSPVPNLMN